MATWEKRQVGRTELQVTTLGLGTATMGGSRIPVTQQEGEAIVRAAWDAGVRYVDTAPFYGVGAAERAGRRCAARQAARRMGAVDQGRPPAAAAQRPRRRRPTARLAPLPFEVRVRLFL